MKFVHAEEPHKHRPGPALLLAGPGSGKTHSVALRIKWLVEDQDVDPKTITVITFTTEAARNMRLRLSDEDKPDVYMPKERQPETICTMHSLGHQILRRNLGAIGLKDDFKVITSDELRAVIFDDAAQLINLGRKCGADAKLAKMKAEPMPRGSPNAQICDAYSSILRACNAVDHDDQILLACKILRRDSALLEEYQGRALHLLVDEYQDINAAQFILIKLLSDKSTDGLYVVGDDDQSIYGFRGGSPEHIRQFTDHFGSAARVLVLPHCRRCPPKVLAGALCLAEKFNVGRLEKPPPLSLKTDQVPITVYNLPSDAREATLIAQVCTRVLPASDVLILLPTNKFADSITRVLQRRRIHHDFRPSIDDEGLSQVSRLFDFLTDPTNSMALRQCIHALCENGVGGIPGPRSRSEEKLSRREHAMMVISTLWNPVLNDGQTLLESLKNTSSEEAVLESLLQHINALQGAYGSDIHTFLETISRTLRPWRDPDNLAREIKSWMGDISRRGGGGEGVARILSMRMAKGLEADHVFVVGLEEGVFPNLKWSSEDVQEAARLFYVSMTRAKTQLHITHVRKRDAAVTFLPASYKLRASRFLEAIPKEHTKVVYVPTHSKKKMRRSVC